MHKIIPKEIREEVLIKARAGEKVIQLAAQYGIGAKTIYGWLTKNSGEEVVSILKYNKLKRENQELKRLLGEVTLEMSLGKKIELVKLGQLKTVRAKALGIERKNIYRSDKLDQTDLIVAEQIKQVHKSDPAYGYRRVAWELGINPKKTLRVMRKFGIKPPRRKRRPYYCTRSTSNHNYTNLIKEINPSFPHQIWTSDVSYIKFQGGFWYLAVIKDLATRQIMAAQVSKHHDAQLVRITILQALRTGYKPQYFHTDQGTEFMAKICTDFLEANNIKVSVSDKASPWQNGYQESFFGRFKDEFGDFNRFNHVGELIEEIYSQIHYYNHRRRHYAFRVAPAVYAKQLSDNCYQKRGA